MIYQDNFDPKRPYRVVAVEKGHGVKYKITQPFKYFFFGYSVKYYNVIEWYVSNKYRSIKWFKNKKEVDSFIEKKEKQLDAPKEIIVFDSLKNND